MVDVDKLSDAELRTKLLEFGFPVMPITGTTRKVMVKKLKLLLENKGKSAARDRRSLAKYSSEEESDQEPVKVKKTAVTRRATMAAAPMQPPATTRVSTRRTQAKLNDSDNESENSVTTTREIKVVSTSRSRTIIPPAAATTTADDFDTGSESESELNKTSASFNNSSAYEFTKKRDITPPQKYTNTLFESKNYSPGPYVSYNSTNNAADRLNQIRSRLSLKTNYESPQQEQQADTPFLSNFTKRLSQLSSATAKNEFDYKNDVIKEHDTNGASSYTRSYFNRPLRHRDLLSREFQTRQENNILKNNLVSFTVLGVAFLFFVMIAVMYLGIRNENSALDTSGYIIPYCNTNDVMAKRGVNCLIDDDVVGAINMQKVLKTQLEKLAIAAKCFDATTKPFMTESEAIQFVYNNYAPKDFEEIKKHLNDFEVLTFKNPSWGISLLPADSVSLESVLENMDHVIVTRQTRPVALAIMHPDLPLKCSIYNKFAMLFNILLFFGSTFCILYLVNYAIKYYKHYQQKRKEEICLMVERIIDILQANSSDDANSFLVINHVRDMILPIDDRKRLESTWKQAVKFINDNDSRVRTEIQIVQGEPYEVWRWLGNSATLSPSRSKTWQGQAFETQIGSVNSLPCSPTPCLKIRGMVDEGDRNYHTIREAVLSKCAHQCRILHCAIEPTSKCVYLKCADPNDAAIAYRNLHGWWYAGHLVTVKYLRLERYMQRFPDSPVKGPPYLKAVAPAADWSN